MPREYVCEACGDRFTARPSRPRRYCSAGCYNARRGPRKPWEERIDRSGGPDSCWEWQGADNGAGYGYVRIGSKAFLAHRLAYASVHGPIPDGLLVLHSCDNRRCCNPRHLRAGTYADNMRDAIERGRWVPWNRSPEKEAA